MRPGRATPASDWMFTNPTRRLSACTGAADIRRLGPSPTRCARRLTCAARRFWRLEVNGDFGTNPGFEGETKINFGQGRSLRLTCVVLNLMFRLSGTCINYRREHFLAFFHRRLAYGTGGLDQENKIVSHPTVAAFIGTGPYGREFLRNIVQRSFS